MTERTPVSLEYSLMNDQMPSAAAELLQSAWQCMRHAERIADANVRFSLAHRSALRAAAAVVALRASAAPTSHGPAMSRPQNVWLLVTSVAPELTEWADYYTCAAPLRNAAESGSSIITSRMADDAIRDAAQFIWDAAAVASRAGARARAPHSQAG